jgi:hypothetical protein
VQSKQYEELCRLFLATELGVGLDSICSAEVPCASLPDKPEYKTQIDLYWHTENSLCQYLNIANAKWRGSEKVDQGEVQLLFQVAQDVRAQKAVMITTIGFTEGALAVADNKGIALHVVRPNFDCINLQPKDTVLIRSQLLELRSTQADPIYTFEVVRRGFDLTPRDAPEQNSVGPAPVAGPVGGIVQGRVVTAYENRAYAPPSHTSVGGGGGLNRSGGPGGYSTRQGGGGGFRKK